MRLEAKFTGRVQGVGFRYTVLRVAQRFDVVGYVRNLPDGAVQVVVEGERGLHEFLDEVENSMSSKIHDKRRREAEATGEFDAFEIRY